MTALTEPGGGSGLRVMRTVARRGGEESVVDGAKAWITNSRRSQLIALLRQVPPAGLPRAPGDLHPARGTRIRADALPGSARTGRQQRGEPRAVLRGLPGAGVRGARRSRGAGFRPDGEGPGGRPPPGRGPRSASAGPRRRTRSPPRGSASPSGTARRHREATGRTSGLDA
ncbi:acyl-CoA dehydrogenase family protein [Streptomyces argenteolus]|uniref:Acyl-CoA dehydrogenase family protein n=1 Tax=Streptomyces argenteolus TaxID=67274 RepID=A0ABW6XDY6_9ACTN